LFAGAVWPITDDLTLVDLREIRSLAAFPKLFETSRISTGALQPRTASLALPIMRIHLVDGKPPFDRSFLLRKVDDAKIVLYSMSCGALQIRVSYRRFQPETSE
jgi:hypothetical protein